MIYLELSIKDGKYLNATISKIKLMNLNDVEKISDIEKDTRTTRP